MPAWLISPDFKSQVGPGRGQVVNPERSPSAPALILPMILTYFLTPLWLKTRMFLPLLTRFVPWFSLLLHRLTCWETAVHGRAWHLQIKLVTGIRLCICNVSVSRKENMPLKSASRTRGRAKVIYHFVCSGCEKTVWQVSSQVQAVRREARPVMGSAHTMLLFHITTSINYP